jgi:hypothetical protein
LAVAVPPTAVAPGAFADEADPQAKEAVPAFSAQFAVVAGGGTLCALATPASKTANAVAMTAQVTRRMRACRCSCDEARPAIGIPYCPSWVYLPRQSYHALSSPRHQSMIEPLASVGGSE